MKITEGALNGFPTPPPPPDALSLACKLGAESAERIASQLGSLLDRGDRLGLRGGEGSA